METFKKKALEEINATVHKAGETIEILENGKYYYEFMFIGSNGVHVDKFDNTIIKLLELSDTDFYESNTTYRFSLEELIEGRAYFLQEREKRDEKYNKIFSNVKVA